MKKNIVAAFIFALAFSQISQAGNRTRVDAQRADIIKRAIVTEVEKMGKFSVMDFQSACLPTLKEANAVYINDTEEKNTIILESDYRNSEGIGMVKQLLVVTDSTKSKVLQAYLKYTNMGMGMMNKGSLESPQIEKVVLPVKSQNYPCFQK